MNIYKKTRDDLPGAPNACPMPSASCPGPFRTVTSYSNFVTVCNYRQLSSGRILMRSLLYLQVQALLRSRRATATAPLPSALLAALESPPLRCRRALEPTPSLRSWLLSVALELFFATRPERLGSPVWLSLSLEVLLVFEEEQIEGSLGGDC